MTTLARPVPSLVAVLTISSVVLLGCSSDPVASPSPTSQPSAAIVVDSGVTDPSSPAAPPTSPTGSSTGGSSDAREPATGSSDAGEPSTGSSDAGSSSAGTTGGPAKIEVSGAICDFLEKKIPVADMATLTGLGVDRTVEMGDTWCVYASSGPDDIVTVQYQEDAKNSFDLNGATGTPVDTTTLGVPMYADQDLNAVYFLDGTTQWTVSVGNAGNGADPAKYAAAITVAQKLLG